MRLSRRRKYLRRPHRLSSATTDASLAPPPILASEPSRVPRWRAEYDQKLPLLLKHFGISRDDPDVWYTLALCLAVAHVPGFQERAKTKSGRKRTLTWEEETKLYARFCQLRQAGHSDRNAAGLMAKESKKAGRSESSGSSILRRMQRHAVKAKQSAAALEGWKALLLMTQNLPP
jgi:hypothetical protein